MLRYDCVPWGSMEGIGFLTWAVLVGAENGTEGSKPRGEGGPRWKALGIPMNLLHWTPFVIGRHENKVVYSLLVLGRNGLALEEGTDIYVCAYRG